MKITIETKLGEIIPEGYELTGKEDLLKKAEKDYPVGTKVLGLYNHDCIFLICDDRYYFDTSGWIYWAGYILYTPISGWAKIIKKPVHKINDIFLYEGDEFWCIDKLDNWKLVKNIAETGIRYSENDCDDIARFIAKWKALDYVMVEARSRLKDNKLSWFGSMIADDGGWEVWIPGTGFWGVIKKDVPVTTDEKINPTIKLMLGKDTVEIKGMIKCNDFQATIKEWLNWSKIFIPTVKSGATIESYLYVYKTYNIDGRDDNIQIGDIKNITLKQIKAITKAIK